MTTWTKTQPELVANVSNEDMRILFYKADEAGGGTFHSATTVVVENGHDEHVDRDIDEVLTPQERVTLLGLLVKFRNDALGQLGFEEQT